MNRYVPLAVAVLALASCAPTPAPKVGPWGYDFSLGMYKDLRPTEDETRLTNEVTFDPATFMASWQRHVARSIFANEPALLDVAVSHFEATRSANSYALTVDVNLRGRQENGRILADSPAHCDIVAQPGIGIIRDSVQQAVDKADPAALTPEGRRETMWQQVWDACVADISTQFGVALAAAR
ncbi:MAG: hypothetical protein GC129_05810 [Proteobacteria bacterium]|nr:hypothetical protein [Pseudomonadota bacterium]